MSSGYTITVIVLGLISLFASYNYYQAIQDYNLRITELNDKLTASEQKTFALGKNLLGKKHTFDFKIVLTDPEGQVHEFYLHKHILRINSEYFDIVLSHNQTDEVHFSNISYQDFNAIIEILYLGNLSSDIPISSLPKVITYLDTFLILDKFRNYTDKYFSNKFVLQRNSEWNNIDLVAKIYSTSKKYHLVATKLAVLNNIYYNWRVQNLFSEEYLIKYPGLFYDYLRILKCDKVYF